MDLGVEAAITSPHRTSFKGEFDRAEYTYWRADQIQAGNFTKTDETITIVAGN